MKGCMVSRIKNSRFAFTLIELLVVIAIIAILAVVVLLTLNPAELLRQSRDSDRVSDMDTLAHAVGVYSEDVASANLGTPNGIYISIPDSIATSTAGDQCQGLGLPALPLIYTYHCVNAANNHNVDGSGWIPVNFKSISSGAPIGSLPVDPTNVSSSDLYYTYTTNGTTYETSAAMESQKYKIGGSNDLITGDGGTKESVFEKGTNLALEPLEYGDPSLVGYWTFEEGSSSIAYDYSGNNATGSWSGTAVGSAGYYSAGKVGSWAGTFDGNTNQLVAAADTLLDAQLGSMTWSFWFKSPMATRGIIYRKSGGSNLGGIIVNFSFNGTVNTPGEMQVGLHTNNVVALLSASSTYNDNNWHLATIMLNRNNNTASLYLDSVLSNSVSAAAIAGVNLNAGTVPFWGGSPGAYYQGLIDDFRIYNRVLSVTEIQSLYVGGK
jgi:prepilin-type N-terminal cleavage/methylation domain-containing protein